MDASYEPERQELIKEVLELLLKRLNPEERIQDLEETIYEMDNPDSLNLNLTVLKNINLYHTIKIRREIIKKL